MAGLPPGVNLPPEILAMMGGAGGAPPAGRAPPPPPAGSGGDKNQNVDVVVNGKRTRMKEGDAMAMVDGMVADSQAENTAREERLRSGEHSPIPDYLKILREYKDFRAMQTAGELSQIANMNTASLYPHIAEIVSSLEYMNTHHRDKNILQMVQTCLIQVNMKKPRLLGEHTLQLVNMMKVGHLSKDPQAADMLMGSLFQVAKSKSDELLPHVDFFIHAQLRNPRVGMKINVLNLFSVLATKNPFPFVQIYPDLEDLIDEPMCRIHCVQIMGQIGRTSYQMAEKCIPLLLDRMDDVDDNTKCVFLTEVKNIGGVYKSILMSHEEKIKEQLFSSNESTRSVTQSILDYMNDKQVHNLNTHLAMHEALIENQRRMLDDMAGQVNEVGGRVTAQEGAIADIEGKQEETDARVNVVEGEVQAQGAAIDDLSERVDDVEIQAKELEDAKAYIDGKVDEMKEFMAGVTKKLPTPSDFSSQGKLRRILQLKFVCSRAGQNCLYKKEMPFITETKEWAKWLKIAVSCVKLGVSVLDGSVGGVLDSAQSIYTTYKKKSDATFKTFVEEPFLTSEEQDKLIVSLRSAKFFDHFKYDSQKAGWCCHNCHDPSKAAPAKEKSSKAAAPAASGDSAIPEAPDELKGFLTKKSRGIRGFAKNWKRRYFIMKDGEIHYYEDETCAKEKGFIKVSDIRSVSDAAPHEIDGKPNGFGIGVVGDKTYTLQVSADSEAEKKKWVDGISGTLIGNALGGMDLGGFPI